MNYDVFNGDADGICALIQLRLAEPRESGSAAHLEVEVHRNLRRGRKSPGIVAGSIR